jgi:hypothetical protein
MTPEEIQKRREKIDDVRDMLDWLEANPDTELPLGFNSFEIWHSSYESGSKERFLETAKAFGTCEKSSDDKEFKVTIRFGSVKLSASIARDQVCTKRTVMKTVAVDEWDCEPLLSQTEIQQIGQEAAVS